MTTRCCTLCVMAAVFWLGIVGRSAATGAPDAREASEGFQAALAEANDAYARGDLPKAREALEQCSGIVKGELSGRFWRAVGAFELRRAGETVGWVLLAWVALGLLGQTLFSARFVVQWLASERRGESVVPVSFWYLSIAGSLLVLSYAVWRLDPVFILAYGFNSFVYVRNLMLIYRKRRAAASAAPSWDTRP